MKGAWIVVALLAALLGRPQDPTPAPFPWLESLDAARALGALEGKPVLAVFRCVP